MPVRKISQYLTLSLALYIPISHAKSSGDWNITETQMQFQNYEDTVTHIQGNYEQRHGVIGRQQAQERFEKALTSYLLEDYKTAAEAFFILLDTESLRGHPLEEEALWYLADSSFRIGQYSVSEEACFQIIGEGLGGIFYADAVRILLENYGIRNKQSEFQRIVEQYLPKYGMESSDKLHYSLGKSYYWQGKTAKAKQALLEVPEGSGSYFQAQYFLGGIYISEKNLDSAFSAFQKAYNPNATRPKQIELNELTNLALARILYKQEKFLEAIAYYQKVGSESKYFVDRLYEMAWTFIGMEQWEDAINVIDIFLIAYPEDENAAKFRNTLGDLYMKTQKYEAALDNYNQVITQLEPVEQRLKAIMSQEALVEELLQAKMNDDVTSWNDAELPAYIEDRLFKNSQLTQTAKVVSLSQEQRKDVEKVQGYAQEIEAVLANAHNELYVFANDRKELYDVELEMLFSLLETLEHEHSLLQQSNKVNLKSQAVEIAQIRMELETLLNKGEVRQTAAEVQVKKLIQNVQEDIRATRLMGMEVLGEVEVFTQEYEDILNRLPEYEKQFILDQLVELDTLLTQNNEAMGRIMTEDLQSLLMGYVGVQEYYMGMVDTVQEDALKTKELGDGVLYDVKHFEDQYAEQLKGLPESQLQDIQRQLKELQNVLKESNARLEELGSEKTRNVLLASLENKDASYKNISSYLVAMQQIHNSMLPQWKEINLKNKAQIQQQMDAFWINGRKIDNTIVTLYSQIDTVEEQQRGVLASLLEEQQSELNEFADDVVAIATNAQDLGMQAAMYSFLSAAEHVEERMLGADFGIVKVYWIRKTDVEEEIERLEKEQQNKLKDLNQRFEIIAKKLKSESE